MRSPLAVFLSNAAACLTVLTDQRLFPVAAPVQGDALSRGVPPAVLHIARYALALARGIIRTMLG